MSKFLEELNIIIKRKKISKNKLAVKIDVDPSSFYQMLAGKRYLNERLFDRLLRSVYKELHADRETGC